LCSFSHTKPKMIMTSNMASFSIPKTLLNRTPHFRDMECKRTQNVFAAMAMTAIVPVWSDGFAPVPLIIAAAKATELVAVLPNMMNEMPNAQVARNRGFFSM